MTRVKDVRDHSPLRLLDRSIHGGLGRGNLGVVCAGAGAGKSAFLVGIALDELMRGCQVLHVALDQPVEHVRNYYDQIFAQLAHTERLENAPDVRLSIERNRRIHSYLEHTFRVEALESGLRFLHAHTDLQPDVIVVDGYVWGDGAREEIPALKRLAREWNAELWMSAGIDKSRPETDPKGYPEPVARYVDEIDVLLRLKGADGTVHLTVLKDHGDPGPGGAVLDLDPTTLLLVRR